MENKRASSGFVGTALGAALTVVQGTHPEWFGNHPWILPVSLVLLFISLLFWATQIAWIQAVLGLRHPTQNRSEDTSPEGEANRRLEAELKKAKDDLHGSAKSNLEFRAERDRCREEKRELQEQFERMFSPLQVEAFQIAKELREFRTGLGPYPMQPKQDAGEDPEKFLNRLHAWEATELKTWNQKLVHGYANRKFGERITALMHRAGEDAGYPAYVPSYAEHPPMNDDALKKLAADMDMVAIWIKARRDMGMLP